MSREHPNIVVCHMAGIDLLDDRDRAALTSVGTLLNTEALADPNDPRADQLLADADVLLGHWGCPLIDAALLDRAPNVGLVAYAAGTIKFTVDASAWGRGVRITSGAKANAIPTAEYAFASILMANKDVYWRRDRPRQPDATRQSAAGPVGNYGKRIGIVGASLVGRHVISLLAPFEHLDVAVYDPFLSSDEAAELGVDKLELDELCASVDVLSIHVPDIPATRKMIGATQLAALRTGATVINTARGASLDHDALLAELQSGRLYAILDVTDPEPLPEDSPFWHLPNVFLTPHLAGSQGSELHRLVDDAVEEIRRWSAGEPAHNEIHLDQLDTLA